MAVTKSVAASAFEGPSSIPSTASTAGELKTAETVTAQTETVEKAVSVTADAVAHEKKLANLAKARSARVAKLQASKVTAAKAAQERASRIADEVAAEAAADRLSFGTIKEVPKTVPTAEEYIRIEIPSTDLFDHVHPGVQLNRHKFEPGRTYLLRGDVALEVRRRLAMFHDEQVRLLRPNADRKALADVNKGSQWTSRGQNAVVSLGRLEDIPTAPDEKIYTVDF